LTQDIVGGMVLRTEPNNAVDQVKSLLLHKAQFFVIDFVLKCDQENEGDLKSARSHSPWRQAGTG
jgi:hypothetical protein